MTHINNYEYVKKWRLLNREKYLQIKRTDTLMRYYYKQAVLGTFKDLSNLFPVN